MSEVLITLSLLIEGLSKKKKALEEILGYTKAQEELFNDETFNLKTFDNIIKNKQFHIDLVRKIDEGFQPSYERIRGVLENNPEIYQEYINHMKSTIKEIGEIHISIQVVEEENHKKFAAISATIKNEVKSFRTSKKTVSNYYNTYQKQKESVRDNFFDSKK